MELPISDRTAAGQALAEALNKYQERADVIVLALPRGGLPVALEVAKALNASLDLMLVRKLGTPGQKELAMGAIASGGSKVMNQEIVHSLGISPEAIEQVIEEETKELKRRERYYRGERPWPKLADQCVILVDDGLATGATMRAAIDAVRDQQPARIVVAVPVAPMRTIAMLRKVADEVICLAEPEPFIAIGQWYLDFSQVSDEEVVSILNEVWGENS
ncbi:MAG TPA: phosphoribosyltransferase [Chromatiales bacterium]|nr:phosphoribosyltransferase [Thiotrichales bacterium]HIP67758.1 phosphoribosyltransferase [Chromatiales bacterium]